MCLYGQVALEDQIERIGNNQGVIFLQNLHKVGEGFNELRSEKKIANSLLDSPPLQLERGE